MRFGFTRQPAAFTLIELLVVISIVALLIALLLPALRMARAQARTVMCMAHPKQISFALMMYAEDYEGYLPIFNPYVYTNPASHEMFWTDMLISGDNPQNGGYLPHQNDKTWINYGAYSENVLRCPEISDEVIARAGAAGGGYGVNSLHVIRQKFYGSQPTPTHTNMHKIMRPSEIWLVGDAQATTLIGYGPGNTYFGAGALNVVCPVLFFDWATTRGTEAGGRHNGGPSSLFHADANVGFIDGHVETRSWMDCYNNYQNMFAHDDETYPHHGPYQ